MDGEVISADESGRPNFSALKDDLKRGPRVSSGLLKLRLARRESGALVYVGRVGTGWDRKTPPLQAPTAMRGHEEPPEVPLDESAGPSDGQQSPTQTASGSSIYESVIPAHPHPVAKPTRVAAPAAYVGWSEPAARYCLVGNLIGTNEPVALDLDNPKAIGVFGYMGSGKSYLLGTLVESSVVPIAGINSLPAPLAVVIFNYRRHAADRFELSSLAQGNKATHPQALLLRCGNLVADALAGHLPLELGKREKDVEGQSPHRRRGVELLGDGDEGHALPIEHLDDLCEIRQRAGQAVDLVDDYDVDQPGRDVG
jgi:hypothetical protein